jgi:hypothetical protein
LEATGFDFGGLAARLHSLHVKERASLFHMVCEQ